MKKMLALTLALVMALGLCACGGDTTDNGDAPAENPEEAASLRKLRLVLRAARSSREQETED